MILLFALYFYLHSLLLGSCRVLLKLYIISLLQTILGGPVGVSVGVTGVFCIGEENVNGWLELGSPVDCSMGLGVTKLNVGISFTGNWKSVFKFGTS